MSKNYLVSALAFLCFIDFSYAKNSVDCRVVTGGTSQCNQYTLKLIRAKEIGYASDTKKLIISKTLPVPKKIKIKVISVADMIEKYVKVEDSLRFKSTYKKPLNVKVIKKLITNAVIKEKKKLTVVLRDEERLTRNTHTLESVLSKKTHTLKRKTGIYTITSGDSLGHLVSLFSISKKELLSYNGIEKKVTLKIGQKFKIPLSQKMIDALSSAKYIIESGDTLLSIAHKFKIEPKDLVSFNHIKSNTTIKKGKKLSLPLPYVIKKMEANKKRLAGKKELELKKKKLAKVKKAKELTRKVKKLTKKKVKMIRGFGKHKLRVTATAYSSHRNQTDSTPFLAAWNNRIRPGMKIIAVSRDMLTRYGLRNGSRVRIGGLRGYYTVRDKMNKRYKKRIDIYMGVNRRRALQWGRRSVMLYW
jgi:LysM repeat protein